VLLLSLPGGTPFRLAPLRALRLLLAVALLCVTGTASRAPGVEGPPPGYKVAFIGDQGLGVDAESVLQLIVAEGADAVLHMGDLDYDDDPAAWEAQIDAILGPEFPYFTSVGNHDTAEWYEAGGYQERIAARMDRLGIPWQGDLGVQSTFRHEGILYVLTAAGTIGAGDGNHDLYIADALSQSDAIWRVSGWHENMRKMQVGEKTDATGWGVYEESRRGGAIMATAHSHSYSRSHLLRHMETQEIASTSEPLGLASDDPETPEDEGRSFVFVSGLGGKSTRSQQEDGDWWASVYTRDQGAEFGALFGEFGHGGDPRMARFYFKDVTGAVVDEFLVRSSVGSGAPGLSIDDISVLESDTGTQDAVFTVSLSAIPEQDVRVEYTTADGTALSGSDYVAVSGELLFQGGETAQTIRVPIVGDRVAEDAETFSVFLSNPQGGVITRALGTAIVTDDDEAQVSLTLSVQGAGGVSLEPPGGVYEPGTLVILTALPAAGSEFAGWSGDLSGTENPTSLLVDTDHSVSVRFDQLPIELLEVQTGGSENAASVATGVALVAGEGDLYVAAIASKPDSVVIAVSGLGLVWEPVAAQCSARGQTGVALWQARGQPLADEAVTAHFESPPRSGVIGVSRYGAADGAGAVVSGNTRGEFGACSGGSDSADYALDLATTSAGARVHVAVAMRDRDHVPGPTWTEHAEVYASSGGSTAGLSLAQGSVEQPAVVSVDGSFGSDVDWAVAAVEIRRPAEPRSLTIGPSPGGSVGLDPPGGIYAAGTLVTLSATPDAGLLFAGWSGDLSGGESPATLVMDDHKNVAARFGALRNVTITPSANGSIALDPPGGAYLAGAIVGVTAFPDAGFLLGGWTGDLSGSQNPTLLAVDADKLVGAAFTRPVLTVDAGTQGSVTLDPPGGVYDVGSIVTLHASPDAGSIAASFAPAVTVHVGPSSGGSVVLDPPDGVYAEGTLVRVTAIPDAVSLFRGWSGDLSGMENPATLVVDGDKTLAAVFGGALLSVAAGEGGSVVLDPPGPTYPLGAVVTLTASPLSGHVFAGWGGDLTGSSDTATLVMDADRSVSADFEPIRSVTVGVTGDGSVALDPPGGLYASGTLVTLTATPAPGFEFAGWSGDLAGTANPGALLVDADRSVDALFVPLPLMLEEQQTGTSLDADSVATGSPLVAAEGDLYLAAVASKSNVVVTDVSGLDLVWEPIVAQCSARDQTGVSLWQARGQPASDQAVTATFDTSPSSALIAVSRYSGAAGAGAVASANTLGVAGACSGGSDSVAYAFDLEASSAGSRVVVAAAMRSRDHVPGPAWTEQVEIHAGSGGSAGGLSIAEGAAEEPGQVLVDGSFGTDVDWAVAAVEIRGAPSSLALAIGSSPGGSVAIDPPGGFHEPGTLVTLTATPEAGHVFAGWSGDLSGSDNPVTLLMNSHKSVAASFGVPWSVTVQTTAGGSVDLDPPGDSHAAGTVVNLTATPDDGYLFRTWGSDLAGTENPTTLLVDGDKDVSAFFAKPVLKLIVRSQGSVTLDPPGGVYDVGSSVTLLASSRDGYVFSGWSGGLSGSENPATLVMDADELVFARFGREAGVGVTPSQNGSVVLDPPGGVYAEGAVVHATAIPDAGYVFRGWSGDLAGTENPATFVVEGDMTLAAAFGGALLSVAAEAGGSVAVDPPGPAYTLGSVVTLTANPTAGHLFTGWGGDLTGAGNPATLVMDADKSVTAGFELGRSVTLGTTAGGSIVLDPPGGIYAVGTVVSVTAIPEAGLLFGGWSGDLAGAQNPISLVVDADKTIGAAFARPTLAVSPGPNGSVSLDPPGGVYDAGTIVTLTAVPDSGHLFAGWSGDLAGTDNPTTISMDADQSVGASFERAYELTLDPTSGGVLTLDPPGGLYPSGTTVLVTATPDPGYLFRGFRGDLSGSGNPGTLVMDADRSAGADFARPILSVDAGTHGNVVLDPPGGVYDAGTVVTLTAEPDSDYLFTGWSGALGGDDNPATIVMDDDHDVTATFRRLRTLTTGVKGRGSVVLDPPGGVYADDTVVTVTAVPDGNARFRDWDGDLSGDGNPETLVMDGDKSVTANFTGN
jgi:uncharacterized repeat protein (TIGR02543 family)